MTLATRLAKGWPRSRLGRTLERYSDTNGSLLAGGIAYSALFSLFAVLTVAFTAAAQILGGNDALTKQVDSQLSLWLPGVLDTGNGGLISPKALVASGALTWTSVAAGVVLVWSALTAMTATLGAVRVMFGLQPVPGNAWKARLSALLAFAVVGVGLLASSAVILAAAWSEAWAKDHFGSTAIALLLRWAAYLLAWMLDAALLALLFTVMAHAHTPKRDLILGCLLAAAAMSVLKRLGAGVLSSASSNPLLASAATVVTLLVWVNVMARVILYTAAWLGTAKVEVKPNSKPDVKPDAKNGQ
jgi:membrane protein